MARIDSDVNIVPSILDRLLDDEPEISTEPASTRIKNLRSLERSVARDLEALLNSRQETLQELPSEFKEVSRSLLTYGLPDFTSFSLLTQEDRLRIRRSVEDAINRFEPRLLRVRVALEAPREHDRGLRFRIDAFLRVDPSPEPVTFDAVLQMNTQQYVIQREQ
ncbi:MAG TPA: type VI secretion system baseplate subunit TssE [Candidatus Binatia bacterium]|nr:type VI secretion system baseplate subunit TssE [Candidatus Binatia bacterium]